MGKYANVEKVVARSLPDWRSARANGLTGIRTVGHDGNALIAQGGHRFINMVCCSYLGLNRHPSVVAGAIAGLEREGSISTSVSRTRIAPLLLDEVETALSGLFRCHAMLAPSCATVSASVLPLLASGHFTGGTKPLLIFDKHCHFSMGVMKAACGDETEVVVCEHNDLAFIEDACRNRPAVAYVADGSYSMGGSAPIQQLRDLQERLGLFLYLDDSHSLSIYGRFGEGLVRSQLETLSERTIVVASLAKAFGATGGVVMLGSPRQRELLEYFGGPMCWSQMLNAAGLGAVLASSQLHQSPLLGELQRRLVANMALFDSLLASNNAGSPQPIRVIDVGSSQRAIDASRRVYESGFYCSAVFFPIVARESAGLRAMCRADLEQSDIERLCRALREATTEPNEKE